MIGFHIDMNVAQFSRPYLEKWLKDRRGRVLSYDNVMHYQRMVVALSETIRVMGEIDTVIDAHGGWPFP